MKLRLVICLFLLTGVSQLLFGQLLVEFETPGIQNFPAQANGNNQFSFFFKIRNVSTVNYTGRIYVMQTVNAGNVMVLDSIDVNSFGPGDAQIVTVSNYDVDVSSGPFIYGRNGIVIWVADDTFGPTSTYQEKDLFVMSGPAFRVGNTPLSSFPSLPEMGAPYNLAIIGENVHDDLYKDTLYLHMEVNGVKQTFNSQDERTVPGHTSKTFLVENYYFNSPPYSLSGTDQVKIWMTGTGTALAVDTLRVDVSVQQPTAISDFDTEDPLQLSPSITRDQFHFSLEPKHVVQDLFLTDLQGKQVRVQANNGNVSLAAYDLSSGIYWFTVNTTKGKTFRVKLLYMP